MYFVTVKSSRPDRLIKTTPKNFDPDLFAKAGYPKLSEAVEQIEIIDYSPTMVDRDDTTTDVTLSLNNDDLFLDSIEIYGAHVYGVLPGYEDSVVYLKKEDNGTVQAIKIDEPFCLLFGIEFGRTYMSYESEQGPLFNGSTFRVSDPKYALDSTVSVKTSKNLGFVKICTSKHVSGFFQVKGYKCEIGNLCVFSNLNGLNQKCGNEKHNTFDACDLGFADNTDGCSN